MKIKIQQAKNRQWYFTIHARNGHVIATSETYTRKRDAIRAAENLCDAMFDFEKTQIVVQK